MTMVACQRARNRSTGSTALECNTIQLPLDQSGPTATVGGYRPAATSVKLISLFGCSRRSSRFAVSATVPRSAADRVEREPIRAADAVADPVVVGRAVTADVETVMGGEELRTATDSAAPQPDSSTAVSATTTQRALFTTGPPSSRRTSTGSALHGAEQRWFQRLRCATALKNV